MKILSKIKNWFFPTKENNFNPSLLRDRAISIFILLFLLIKVIFSFNLILVKQSSLFADISAQKIFSLTNEIRQEYGLATVTENTLLNQAAQYKAQDMLQNSYFSHYSPIGISPWYWIEKSGYDYYYAGENLAMNFLDSEEVVRGWFNSPTHKDNLLNANYQEMGIAVISGDFNNEGINRILVVQLFGSTKSKPIIPIAEAQEITTPEIPIEDESSDQLEETEDIIPSEIVETETENEILSEQIESKQIEPEIVAEIEQTKDLPEQPEETSPQKIVQIEDKTKTQSDIIIGAQLAKQSNLSSKINNNIRNQMNLADRIIAGFMISFGLIILTGIILQKQSINFGFSELVLRSFIIILLGISFITFHIESVIGRLMIS